MSIQAQVINLLIRLQETFGISYVLISHNLPLVQHISDRIAVMYLGRIVELTDATELYQRPRHPYSEILLNAVPIPDPTLRRESIPQIGEPPSPVNPPSGCHFHPRCPYAQDICQRQRPDLIDQGDGHLAACHFSDQVGRYLKA